MSLFDELKRRKVIRVAVVYAATAFAVLQAADIMLPRMGVPEWAMGLLVAFVVLGFPIALVLGWALEVTPDGIKRTEAAPVQTEPGTTPSLLGKRTLIVAGLLVVLGIGLSAGWLLKPGEPGPVEPAAVVESGTAAVPAATDEERPPKSMPAAERESIAVLPFVNMSPDPENAYFADGISEELLNILAGIEGLKVASRTSAFSFKGSNTPIPEIARQLGVRHVLEGSVRKQGNQVRITAQLIEAGDDAHLWSERYDRNLDDIFKVQEEIAQAITLALEDVLGARRVTVQASTTDLEVYERFLSGRARFHQRTELDQAIADLEYAVEHDPDLAEAWIYLAAAHYVAPGYQSSRDMSYEATQDAGRAALARAAMLLPNHPLVVALQATLEAGHNKVAALALLERAGRMRSQDSTPTLWHGLALLQAGYIDEAISVLERAHRMDPRAGINSGYLGVAYLAAGRDAEAEEQVRLARANGWASGVVLYALELAARGERARAGAFLRSALDAEALQSPGYMALLAAFEDPANESILLEMIGNNNPVSEALISLGRENQFLDAALLLARRPEGEIVYWLRMAWQPAWAGVREDSRFFEIARELGQVELWEARGYPPGCRAVDDPTGRRLDCPGMRR